MSHTNPRRAGYATAASGKVEATHGANCCMVTSGCATHAAIKLGYATAALENLKAALHSETAVYSLLAVSYVHTSSWVTLLLLCVLALAVSGY